MILALRTDKPEAELYLYQGKQPVGQLKWQAHRQLSATIHQQIYDLLNSHQVDSDQLNGLIFYKGAGSFTGLRIGASVANAMATALNIPVTASAGNQWLTQGLKAIGSTKSGQPVVPDYGAPLHITKQQK